MPLFGSRVPAETLRRFWTMLAHHQGGLFNASRLAQGLEVKGQTVSRYADLLVDLLLVRRLQPYQVNVAKRLVKSPRIYVRDSGITHALLNISSYNDLLGHPGVGKSWEGGFCREDLPSRCRSPWAILQGIAFATVVIQAGVLLRASGRRSGSGRRAGRLPERIAERGSTVACGVGHFLKHRLFPGLVRLT